MAIKRINYDESLRYYLKDSSDYFRKECHVNTFQKFYDHNFQEVEKNEKQFKYVVGLFMNELNGKKICYIHSWIEKNNEVIDVTPFANVFINETTKLEGKEYEEFVKSIKNARYLPIKSITNAFYNAELNKRFLDNQCRIAPERIAEQLLREWINEVENDRRIEDQIDKYGYTFFEENQVF